MGVPAIEEGEDSRKQAGGNHGMAFARPMDKVDGVISERDVLVVQDHLDGIGSVGHAREAAELVPRMPTMTNDIDEITALNPDFVASAQNSDVRRFDEIRAPEFYFSNPDKSLVDCAAFLEQTAKPVAIKNLQAHDVKIRIMGNFAIIHAATSYTTPDGQQAHGRYTDCWAKQNGKWLAVSAHYTR
jgi:ketosteroid isomerase-like protein